jgi:ABC-type glycerol-3-phosphate transport system permease component
MSTQQIRDILIVLVGVIMLLASMGTAWALSRYSRAGSDERGWFVITLMISIALFIGGIIVCNYGVRAFLGDKWHGTGTE